MIFNVSPHYFKKVTKDFTYDGKVIPVICENWIKIKDFYYNEIDAKEGTLCATQIVYRLR